MGTFSWLKFKLQFIAYEWGYTKKTFLLARSVIRALVSTTESWPSKLIIFGLNVLGSAVIALSFSCYIFYFLRLLLLLQLLLLSDFSGLLWRCYCFLVIMLWSLLLLLFCDGSRSLQVHDCYLSAAASSSLMCLIPFWLWNESSTSCMLIAWLESV